MKKSLIALLLVVALVVTVSVFAVSAEETQTPAKQTWSHLTVAEDGQTATGYCPHCCASTSETVTWTLFTPGAGHNRINGAAKTGHKFLNDSFTNNGAIWTDKSNLSDFVLHLNGNSYARNGNAGSGNDTGALRLTSNTKMFIVDDKDNLGTISANIGWAVYLEAGAPQFTMYSGNLVSTMASKFQSGLGGTVCVKSGTFTMEGGAITDGYNTYGGAIYAAAGTTVNLNGGTISGTSAERGGAIYATGKNAKVVIDGATINNCYATNRAGGIMLTGATDSAASMEFKSGTLSNCYVTGGNLFGGNIYLEFAPAVVSGGIIENGGKAVTGAAATPAAGQLGGNFCLRGNGASLTVKDNAIIRNGGAKDGGNIYVGAGDLIIESGTISGGNATTTGGNIFFGSSGTMTIDAAEGKTVKITGGSAKVAGNISATAGTANITGPDVTISGGTGTGTNLRVGASKVNLTDINIKGAGAHTDSVSIGTNAKVKLIGSTSLDKIQVEGQSGGGLVSGAQILIAEGYTGTTYVGWSDATITANVDVPGTATDPSLWQEADYKGTGNVYALNADSSSKMLADTGDAVEADAAAGTAADNKFVTAVAAGVKIDAEGKETKTPLGTMPDDATAYDYVVPYYNGDYTLACDTVMDNNNSVINVITNGFKLGLIENRSNDFSDKKTSNPTETEDMTGYVTIDDATKLQMITKVKGNNYQYITLPFGQGYTARRVAVNIDSVSIRPATADLYYTTKIAANDKLTECAISYGVVLSLDDMPDEAFVQDAKNLYTEINFPVFEDGAYISETTNSTLLQGILNENAPAGQNKEWGEKPIYANAFVCFNIDNKDYYVMADEPVQYSLKDIMEMVDGNEELAANASVIKMYKTWSDPLANWGLDNIAANAAAVA